MAKYQRLPGGGEKPWFTGWDGREYTVGDRVELHPSTDFWARGARYGEVVGSSLTEADRVHVELDKLPGRKFGGPEELFRLVG